jgi:hypothetical protein
MMLIIKMHMLKNILCTLFIGGDKECTWEQAASDLSLKVVKLEEQLKTHKLLIDQLNKYIICQKQS